MHQKRKYRQIKILKRRKLQDAVGPKAKEEVNAQSCENYCITNDMNIYLSFLTYILLAEYKILLRIALYRL